MGYLAPEILREESYGIAADVWSIGINLHLLLSGRPPFHVQQRGSTRRINRAAMKYMYEQLSSSHACLGL